MDAHDAIFLGEIEQALKLPNISRREYIENENHIELQKNDENFQEEELEQERQKYHKEKIQQLERLPLLLRLLSNAQEETTSIIVPALIETDERFICSNKSAFNNDDIDEEENEDIIKHKIISGLEEVATSTPSAENIDVLVSYITPFACRKISKCKPLKRKLAQNLWQGDWDLNELKDVHEKKDSAMISLDSTTDMDVEEKTKKPAKFERARMIRTSSVRINDSQETIVNKLLSEITSLVIQALSKIKFVETKTVSSTQVLAGTTSTEPSKAITINNTTQELKEKPANTMFISNELILCVDSLLAESSSDYESQVLTAILPALIYYSPILRHDHVSNAICRCGSSILPKTASALLSRMVACAPLASHSVIRGCVNAYLQSKNLNDYDNDNVESAVMHNAKAAIVSIANLSKREAMHITRILLQYRIMPDLYLELMVKYDTETIPNILLNDFIAPSSTSMSKEDLLKDNKRYNITVKNRFERKIKVREKEKQDNIKSKAINWEKREFSWLKYSLAQNESLAIEVRRIFLLRLSHFIKHSTLAMLGEISITLRSLAFLLNYIGIGSRSTLGSGSKFVQEAVKSVRLLVLFLLKEMPLERRSIQLRSELISCIIFICCQYPPIFSSIPSLTSLDSKDSQPIAKLIIKTLEMLLCHDKKESITDIIQNKLASWVLHVNVEELKSFAAHTLHISDDEHNLKALSDNLEAVCLWIQSNLDLSKLSSSSCKEHEVHNEEEVTDDDLMNISKDQLVRERSSLYCHISSILKSEDKCYKLFFKSNLLSFIHTLIEALVPDKNSHHRHFIPIITAKDLVMTEHALYKKNYTASTLTSKYEQQFIIQLLYAFEYFIQFPASPFSFNPRLFSCFEALSICDRFLKKKWDTSSELVLIYRDRLEFMMNKCCPETLRVITYLDDAKMTNRLKDIFILPNRKIKELLINTIHNCIYCNQMDPSGKIAEMIYLQARKMHSPSDIDVTVICVLLKTSPNSPLPYYTYSSFCNDPLLLMKCYISSWKIRGLRQIILQILTQVLQANSQLTFENTPNKNEAYQMIFARDLVAVRSLAVISSGMGICNTDSDSSNRSYLKKGSNTSPSALNCPMTISFLRHLISQRKGLITCLLKQGFPYLVLDWLIDFIPEVLNETKTLKSTLMSNQSALTPSECLVVADAALRIALAHGTRDEKEAQQLVFASFTCLHKHFYLIVGPPSGGVAVNVLCDEGVDITENCRVSALRMLHALQRVNNSTGKWQQRELIRVEALIGLNKLASLCKSENLIGISGIAATRKRHVLKETWDAIVKAINAMGGSLQV